MEKVLAMHARWLLGSLCLLTGSCGVHPSESPEASTKRGAVTGEVTGTGTQGTANSASAGCSSAALSAVTQVINTQCVSCHGSGKTSPDLSSAINIETNKSAVVASVTAGRMPPSQPLAASDLQAFSDWSVSTQKLSLLAESPPTYEGTVKGIFGAKCATCHSPTAPVNTRETPYLTTYAQVKAAYGASIQEMNSGSMPPPGAMPALTTSDINTIVAWKNAGYPVGTAPVPVDTTASAVYFNTIKTFLVSRCTSCHATGLQGPDLTTYDLAKAGSSRSLIRMQAGTMPPAGALPAAETTLFAKWISTGFPLGNGTPEANPPAATAPVTPADTPVCM